MSEMIERVARAIYDKSPLYTAKPNIGEPMHALTWDEAEKYGREDYFDQARAAIEAYEAALKDEGFRIVNPPAHHGIMFAHLGAQTGTAINEGK